MDMWVGRLWGLNLRPHEGHDSSGWGPEAVASGGIKGFFGRGRGFSIWGC